MKKLTWVLALFLVFTPLSLLADEVTLKDGRTFKGKVQEQNDKVVKFKTTLNGLTTILILNKEDIKNLTTEVVAYKKDKAKDKHPYIEIPIVGKAGENYFAKGIADIFAYAKEHGVKDLVFYLDTMGGDLNEALSIYKLLGENKDSFTYHMVIKRCEGVALAVGLWEDTLTIVEGAVIAGPGAHILPTENTALPEEEMVILAQLAAEFSERHAKNERRVYIIKALFDAEETAAIWTNNKEEVIVKDKLPKDLPHEQVLVDDGEEKTLFMSYDVLVALGLPILETGETEELGKLLKFNKWVSAGDFGYKTMKKFSKEYMVEYELKEKMKKKNIQHHLESREKLYKHLQHNIQQASKFDPSKASYATYHDFWGWGHWRWRGNNGGRMTEVDREKWQLRTDIALKHLKKAQRTLPILKRKIKASIELGLKPPITLEKLAEIKTDIDYKIKELALEKKTRHLPGKKK